MARVRTSPTVRVLLYGLVAYVVIMLLLILVRFLRIFPTHNHQRGKTAVVMLVDAQDTSSRF